MEVVGFANPDLDPQAPDTSLWNAHLEKVPVDMSVEKSKFLLGQVGYKFCELFHQEKEAYFEHMSEDKTIAWKQAVQGVREMCDVCSTTLFNYHWVCSTCGFVVCIDCYKGRKHGYCKNDTGTRDRDGYMWLNCTTREPHIQEKLMLTQIIPSNCLYKLVRQMHGICALLEIPLNCECPLSKESLFRKIKDRLEFIYPITVEHIRKDEDTLKTESVETDMISTVGVETITTTKMISITVKNIESRLSEADSGTVCCKVIFGRELSADKNPAVEILKRREKQSYSFDGFQEDIKIESLDDYIEGRKTPLNECKLKVNNAEQTNETKSILETTESDKFAATNVENKENGNDTPSVNVQFESTVEKCVEKDPLETNSENNIQNSQHDLDTDSKLIEAPAKDSDTQDDPPYNEEHRLKPSPKLDWKTFNMIVKQLLKFDKSINISGLFEKHLTEKCPESESLVDFTAEIEVNHTNIQSFLHDFLDQFVFLTGPAGIDNLADNVQILEYNKYIKNCIEFQNKGERVINLVESQTLYPNVAHQWLCNGRLLRLLDPLNDDNYAAFHDQWERGQPVMVSYVSNKMDMRLWQPQSFSREFGEDENDLINCLNGKLVKSQKMKLFWGGFEKIGLRLLDERDRPMLLKLKDWPPGDDFAEMMPSRFDDLMMCLPLAEYTRREGRLNLASRLCSFFVRPDLGPKMYSAYGSALHPSKGTTNLHLDVSDAVNVMVYVSVPKDVDQSKYIQKVYDAIDRDECDVYTRQRIREKDELPGALWHIYHAKDADKIRSLLNKIEVERGGSIKANHDPIHDQKWYLDANLRKRLLEEYNVVGYSIVQCSGDAIFIPAGAPHQVRNLHNCIKVAEDFVSPENISYCFKLTNEFRHLTNTHSNHEDKLQIKNIIYHTVKDAVSCLANPLIMTKDKIDLL
ncbi:lysine-specific demethylase 3B [Topomyia yanbarensis]|uniref:lysine-specific demethylase 3B n=1 Tax=Topomyia yanbarensis TaxID=2498891 RepID=UPI00273ABC4C|nr:lysine-specific demethylase 3B [Topomyia yanbarensis]